jgi:hypothetical protein
MSDEYIWIITDDVSQPLPAPYPDGERSDGRLRNPYDQPGAIEIGARRGIPVKAEKLEQGMGEFLDLLGRVFNHAQLRAGELAGMELEEIELAVEISGEGQVSLLGTGGKMGGKGAMTLKFKKASK